MKLGDIKTEALKIMFVSYGEVISADNLENYEKNENYSAYLVKMNGSINRCFADLERKGIVPASVKIFEASDGVSKPYSIEFDLSALDITDFVRLAYENEHGVRISNFGDYEYIPEEKRLIARKIGNGENYRLTYRKRLKRLGAAEPHDSEIELPDTITSIIPLFIKGDLFREDEPNEASEARNWYESATEDILNREVNQTQVESVFSLNKM